MNKVLIFRYYSDPQGNLVCHNCAAVCYQGSLSPVDENNEELVLGDQDCHCGGEFICKLECCSLSHYLHHLGLYKNRYKRIKSISFNHSSF
jgi:hypothetical protein